MFMSLYSYAYKRLKWMGNQDLSRFITLLFLALWHGTWSGYFINFTGQFFASGAERQVIIFVVAL